MSTKTKVVCDFCGKDVSKKEKISLMIYKQSTADRSKIGNHGMTRELDYDLCDDCCNFVTTIIEYIRKSKNDKNK